MQNSQLFTFFLQRVHCVEVKSAVDVEMFTALPDSASSLFTATQTANGCTGHDACRRCSEYTMAVILFITFLAVSRHHAQAFWAVLLRVSKLNSRLNWLAGASILPDRPRAHVTSMASTGNKFVITLIYLGVYLYTSNSVCNLPFFPLTGANSSWSYSRSRHDARSSSHQTLLPAGKQDVELGGEEKNDGTEPERRAHTVSGAAVLSYRHRVSADTDTLFKCDINQCMPTLSLML